MLILNKQRLISQLRTFYKHFDVAHITRRTFPSREIYRNGNTHDNRRTYLWQRFIHLFANFSMEKPMTLPRTDCYMSGDWLFPRMRRWMRRVFSYLSFVSLCLNSRENVFVVPGQDLRTSRERRYAQLHKRNNFERFMRMQHCRPLGFDNNYRPCGKKKTR